MNEKQKQQRELKELFDIYHRPLVLFARNFIEELPVCEDIVQETFIVFWKKKPNFSNEKALRSYLYTAVKNKCFNYLNHQKIKANHARETIALFKNEKFIIDKESESEVTQLLYNAINQLPERRKEVLMWMLKGLRNQEIAARMNIQIQTVKTLRSQAYSDLRAYFDKCSVISKKEDK